MTRHTPKMLFGLWPLMLGAPIVAAACVTSQPTVQTPAAAAAKPPTPYARPAAFDTSLADARLGEGAAAASPDQADPAAARRLLAAFKARGSELTGWVLPNVRSYLPPGTSTPGRIYIGYGLAEPISSDADGAVFLDIGAPAWAGSVDRLWTAMVRELYQAPIRDIGANAPSEPTDEAELSAAVLTRVLQRGMPYYVAAHGRPDFLGDETYEVLQRRAEVSDRFLVLRDTLRLEENGKETARQIQRRWQELIRLDSERQVFSVVGAYMAEAIERENGRAALAAVVGRGPRAFFEAYQALAPGALVSFVLPEASDAVELPREPLLSH